MQNIYDKLPAYLKIKLFVLKQIETGAWPPHAKIPSEENLCIQFGVARGTVRQALSELSNEGLIYRIHGKGSFVKAPDYEHDLDTGQFVSIWDEMMGKGIKVDYKILGAERCLPEPQVASHLFSDRPQEEVFRIRRIRGIDDKWIMYSENQIPCSIYPQLIDEPENMRSIYGTLKSKAGIHIDMGQRVYSFMTAEPYLAELLCVEVNHPVIFVEQIVYDTSGRCVDCAKLWLRSEYFKLSINMRSKKR